MYTFNMGADHKSKDNNSSGEYFKLSNQKAKVKKQGSEQHLKTNNKLSEKGIPRHEVKIDKLASQQSKPMSNMRSSELEMSPGLEDEVVQDKAQNAAQNGFLNNNTKRQNIYIKKIREYMNRIDKLQDELGKCKTENESLIFDLRECKTKMAFLEEKKAMLQIELAREKKKKVKNGIRNDISDDAGAEEEDQRINLTVHSQPNWGGCFPMCGGKQKMTMKVTPALQ